MPEATQTIGTQRVTELTALEESKTKWTAQKLFKSTIKMAGWRKEYSSSKSRNLRNVTPFVGTKSVVFHWEHMGLTVKALHQIYIAFFDVDVSMEARGNDFTHTRSKGEDFWFSKLDMRKNPCRVRCSCKDFYFTFSYWNYLQNALYGRKPKVYKPVGDTKRKPRNPEKLPGMCKHLVNSLLWLQTQNYARGPRIGR
ncbi:MAG: hypothetical protein ACTSRU_14300 [Candidatus Hodarchaeales archaeon]